MPAMPPPLTAEVEFVRVPPEEFERRWAVFEEATIRLLDELDQREQFALALHRPATPSADQAGRSDEGKQAVQEWLAEGARQGYTWGTGGEQGKGHVDEA